MKTVVDWSYVGEVDGFEISAELLADDVSVLDFDGYDAETVKAFNAGDWGYVGLVVTASRDDIRLGESSVWGCEYGYLPVAGFINPLTDSVYYPDLIIEAVNEAQRNIEKLRT